MSILGNLFGPYPQPPITSPINPNAGQYITTNGTGASWTSTGHIQPNVLSACDIILDGTSLKETLGAINERLLILTPDPEKLEKYEALRLAYEQYKLMESLLK